MRTLTAQDIEIIGNRSANLNWTDPKCVRAEIVAVGKKFAVLWATADGMDRVYGMIEGRVTRSPLRSRKDAEAVRAYLLRDH